MACFLVVVSYRNSTSNHNSPVSGLWYLVLYLIEILHQTTTRATAILYLRCCILSKFYIKPQHWRQWHYQPSCCILSKFYIKPQLQSVQPFLSDVVSYRNSTSNHNKTSHRVYGGCVVSYRNSTSNHNRWSDFLNSEFVVSYRNSTSNHNQRAKTLECYSVVSYRNSTSNHNLPPNWSRCKSLYLIEILHQTTTRAVPRLPPVGCILSKFYIKPQRRASY